MKKIFTAAWLSLLLCCKDKNVAPPEALLPLPAKHQKEWQDKELFAFVHFTVNTFTDKEWGYGDEDPNLFNPTDFDPEQWVRTLKDAGFKGAILTAKHHDGFCLWPSKYTEYSVKNSTWRNGKGDVVRDFKKACDKYGLEFGIYLSPWDRNHAEYGSPAYLEYYRNQLNELLEEYGPMFEIWFDGAKGDDGYYGGAREKREVDDQVYYNWPETFAIVRNANPETIIRGDARATPDSRWCGNEDGHVGETNWNMVSPDTLTMLGAERTALLYSGSPSGIAWMPAEVDVSIRPGWFYHAAEDSLVKTPDQLFEIYLNAVGRGSPLLLNVAPDKRGLIPDQDIQSLLKWKEKIDRTFDTNLALASKVTASNTRGGVPKFGALNAIDENTDTYWATDDTVINASIEIAFEQLQNIQYVIIQEPIQLGQRIKAFNLEVLHDGSWVEIAQGTTVGHKRILAADPVKTQKLRINIRDAKAAPVLSNIAIY